MPRLPEPRPGPRWGNKRIEVLGDAEAAPGPKDRKACAKVGEDQAIQVCVTRPARQTRVAVEDPAAVCRLLRGAKFRDRESFFAIPIDARGQVLGVEEVARGQVSGVDVHPREVFKSSVLLGASAVVLAHNHPSGNPTASADDRELTQRMVEVGRTLGIPVIDHVIVGDGSCYSFGETDPMALRGPGRARKPRRRRRARR